MSNYFKRIVECFNVNRNRHATLYAIYCSLSITLLYNPLDPNRLIVNSFSGMIGKGLIENIDTSRRVSNFGVWLLIFCVSFIVTYLISNYWLNNQCSKSDTRLLSLMNSTIVLANINLISICISYFKNRENNCSPFSISYYFLLVVLAVLFFKISYKNSGKVFGLLNTWSVLAYGISMVPFMCSAYLEIIYILLARGYFIKRPIILGVIIVFTVAFIIVVFFKKLVRAGKKLPNLKSWSYIWLITGISSLKIQILLEDFYSADIFESANYSVLISDFFGYNQLPLVEHYGGHMLTGVFEGILYGLLNNDYVGSIYSPYANLIVLVCAVLFYMLISEYIGKDLAFLTTLVLPYETLWNYYGLLALVCLSVIYFMKKKSYRNAVFLWTSCIICAFYRLDLGYSVILATVISLMIYIVVDKNYSAAKKLIITLGSFVAAGVLIWIVLCVIKGVGPIIRLKEFLYLNFSNLNWGRGEIGNTGEIIFPYCYVIIPFMVCLCLIGTVFIKSIRENIGDDKWISLLIIGMSYMTNFSRGLVRHTVIEKSLEYILWSACIFISLYMVAYTNKKIIFSIGIMIFVLINSSVLSVDVSDNNNLLDSCVDNIKGHAELFIHKSEDNKSVWDNLVENKASVTRVKPDFEMQELIKQYDIVLNSILDNDETYVDFINKTFIYSAIGKKCPVYISQSPMQLSGEYTQERFIKEIEDVPIVLMPVNKEFNASMLDSIPNSIRYYIVSEYIYQHYIPLFKYVSSSKGASYAVWCLPEREEELRDRLDVFMNSNEYFELLCEENERRACGENKEPVTDLIDLIDYGYDGPFEGVEGKEYLEGLHTYNIEYLPYILNLDDSFTPNIINEALANNSIYTFEDIPLIKNENSVYVELEVSNAAQDEDIILLMGNNDGNVFDEKCRYTFKVKNGTSRYIIRVSNDYYWYLNEINAIKAIASGSIEIRNVYMCSD